MSKSILQDIATYTAKQFNDLAIDKEILDLTKSMRDFTLKTDESVFNNFNDYKLISSVIKQDSSDQIDLVSTNTKANELQNSSSIDFILDELSLAYRENGIIKKEFRRKDKLLQNNIDLLTYDKLEHFQGPIESYTMDNDTQIITPGVTNAQSTWHWMWIKNKTFNYENHNILNINAASTTLTIGDTQYNQINLDGSSIISNNLSLASGVLNITSPAITDNSITTNGNIVSTDGGVTVKNDIVSTNGGVTVKNDIVSTNGKLNIASTATITGITTVKNNIISNGDFKSVNAATGKGNFLTSIGDFKTTYGNFQTLHGNIIASQGNLEISQGDANIIGNINQTVGTTTVNRLVSGNITATSITLNGNMDQSTGNCSVNNLIVKGTADLGIKPITISSLTVTNDAKIGTTLNVNGANTSTSYIQTKLSVNGEFTALNKSFFRNYVDAVGQTVRADIFDGTATKAQYADLAEMYTTDQYYEPGTVLSVGKTHEATLFNNCTLLGVVSTKPGYLLNSDTKGVAIALKGRVPVKTKDTIQRGEFVVPDIDNPGYCKSSLSYSMFNIGIAISNSENGKVEVKV